MLDQSANAAHSNELLLARGDFVAGLVYEALTDEQRPYLRFEELLVPGEDFDRIRYSLHARGQPTNGKI